MSWAIKLILAGSVTFMVNQVGELVSRIINNTGTILILPNIVIYSITKTIISLIQVKAVVRGCVF